MDGWMDELIDDCRRLLLMVMVNPPLRAVFGNMLQCENLS